MGDEPSHVEPLPYWAAAFSHGPDGSTLSLGSSGEEIREKV